MGGGCGSNTACDLLLEICASQEFKNCVYYNQYLIIDRYSKDYGIIKFSQKLLYPSFFKT